MSRSTQLVSTGICVPATEVSNQTLRERFKDSAPTFVDKMEASTGILTRWHGGDDQATSDLAVEAGQNALEAAGLPPSEVDLIILGTDSPDYITPATSVVVQHKLGAVNAGTFDVGCACASFPTALAAGSGLINTNPGLKNVLVIGAYMMQRLGSPDDPMTFFYGDGAGAAVLTAADEPGFIGSAFRADGSYAERWGIMSGGTREPATVESVKKGRTQVRVYDRYPPEVNEEGWPQLVQTLAEQNDFSLQDVGLFVFTQVRKPTIEKVMDTLGAPRERTHTIMEKWGYTGSACIPMALHDALAQGKAGAGDLVVMVGSGVGYNQAAAAIRLTDTLR